jgi:hypothetical protein
MSGERPEITTRAHTGLRWLSMGVFILSMAAHPFGGGDRSRGWEAAWIAFITTPAALACFLGTAANLGYLFAFIAWRNQGAAVTSATISLLAGIGSLGATWIPSVFPNGEEPGLGFWLWIASPALLLFAWLVAEEAACWPTRSRSTTTGERAKNEQRIHQSM